MDWFIGLLLLLVGGIIGFFVAQFFIKEKQQTSGKTESEQTIQELMNQQAAVHIQETKRIAVELIAQSASLKCQIEDYEQLLISQQDSPEGSSMNYFGEQTTAYLRNKSNKPTREKSSADIQPLDFSSQSSGLFSGNKEAPVKDGK
ncbi:MAG: uncharacterized membrane-anchored protein YhcB (DUF1043 family) [Paraglaciecola sp.]|jgi:uncharacterized membrane-anchored protein YhcB (DUF1043 family)